MLTGGIPRGALWLAGGILATILGAVVNQIFHDRVVAVIASMVFAVAFGAAVERMAAALKRRTSRPASPPAAQDPVDEVRTGDHTS